MFARTNGVEVVGLLAGDRVTLPVPGSGHRIDRVDGPSSCPQAGDQQPAGGLDGHRDRRVRGVAVGGEEVEELLQARGVVVDPGPA